LPSVSGGGTQGPPACWLSSSIAWKADSGVASTVSSDIMMSPGMVWSFLAARLALAEIAERSPRFGVGKLGEGGECLEGDGGAAERVGEIDEHRKAPVLLEEAVGHGNERGLVDVVHVSVEQLRRRM